MSEEKVLLQLQDLRKYFTIKKKYGGKETLKAVDGVNLTIHEGEVVGLVGESGCGKSTLGRSVIKLNESTSGKIIFKGEDITKYNFKQMRGLRSDIQIIFQDPYASLNPRMTISEIVRGPLDSFNIGKPDEREALVVEMLKKVGLTEEYLHKLPHEMSGGQRQRVVIARAMISKPSLVVCDEPVSALDVSVRAQVLNLMKDMQKESGTAYLFISHDLSTVKYICDKIAVMYLGHIVELANSDELFLHPVHPYTQALLSAIPVADVDYKRNRIVLQGDVPSPVSPPSGCPFRTRCPKCSEACSNKMPLLNDVNNDNHLVACFKVFNTDTDLTEY